MYKNEGTGTTAGMTGRQRAVGSAPQQRLWKQWKGRRWLRVGENVDSDGDDSESPDQRKIAVPFRVPEPGPQPQPGLQRRLSHLPAGEGATELHMFLCNALFWITCVSGSMCVFLHVLQESKVDQ